MGNMIAQVAGQEQKHHLRVRLDSRPGKKKALVFEPGLFDQSTLNVHLESIRALKEHAKAEPPMKLKEKKCKQAPDSMRQKVAQMKKMLSKDPFAFEALRRSEERKRSMEDLRALGKKYAGEIGISLYPLMEYPIAKGMAGIFENRLTERSARALLKMSGLLIQQVKEHGNDDPQQRRCAGDARTLASLLKDLFFMHHYFEREDYLAAIEIYRKLVPEKNADGRTRKHISKAAEMMMNDWKFIGLMHAFISKCIEDGPAARLPAN